MKRILFTLLLAVVLMGGIAVECALAADRNYKIENCNRKKLWEDFSIHLQIHKSDLIEFLNKNIKPNKEGPKLSESDYKDIEKFDKKFHYYISECILFMKEANQLIDFIYKINPDKALDTSMEFIRLFSRQDIPYINTWNATTQIDTFSFNFGPLRPNEIY